ncbi:MAG: AAA family ATPase [Candidatus Onthomonas sp.]
MKHIVITVGCEYGCGGPKIGKIIAEDLGIEYYDRALIDSIIEETGVSHSLMEMAESGVDIKGRDISLQHTQGPKYSNLTQRVVYIQTEVVKKLAERTSCVIIGRCSDYILRDRTDCLNVFIYAPDEVRVKTVMEEQQVTEEQARALIEQNDKMLHARYKQMTGTYRGDRHNRHMLIDSSLLGIDRTAKFIEGLAAQAFGEAL